MKFELSKTESLRLRNWKIEHDKTCRFVPTKENPFVGGAIGGRLTYHFTPTSIGLGVSVSCACGSEVNITEYENW
jgi:hypothetical protein